MLGCFVCEPFKRLPLATYTVGSLKQGRVGQGAIAFGELSKRCASALVSALKHRVSQRATLASGLDVWSSPGSCTQEAFIACRVTFCPGRPICVQLSPQLQNEKPSQTLVWICCSRLPRSLLGIRLPSVAAHQRSGLVARVPIRKSSHSANTDALHLYDRAMAAVRGRHSCLPRLPIGSVDQSAYSCHPTCLVAVSDGST